MTPTELPKLCRATDKKSSWLTQLVAPVLSALLIGAGAYVAMVKELTSLSSSVNKMSMTVDRLETNQTKFFEAYIAPLMIRIERLDSKIGDTSNSVQAIKDEMRILHPVRPYGNRTY